jgi:hypothetical protein
MRLPLLLQAWGRVPVFSASNPRTKEGTMERTELCEMQYAASCWRS